MVKCKRCNFDNPEGLKFCGNCGAKLLEKDSIAPISLLTLAYLHIVGGAYLILLIIPLFTLISILATIPFVAGFLNLYIGWKFYLGKVPKMAWLISLIAIILGLSFTLWIYTIPAWIIFIINFIALWQSLKELMKPSRKSQP